MHRLSSLAARLFCLLCLVLSVKAQTAGTVDTGYNPAVAGDVYSTAVQADGRIIIGGGFTISSGGVRSNLARLNPNGTLDTSFNTYVSSDVFSAAVQEDGKIVIAGTFFQVAGVGRNRIARLNANGTVDTGFNPNANSTVLGTLVQADGRVVIVGYFTSLRPNGAASSTTRNRIARLNADGTLDPGFDPNADGTVNAVAVQEDGKILIGGSFTMVGGALRNRIARLNADGSLDPAFDPSASGTVNAIAVGADAKIVLGGSFTTVHGVQHSNLARLNADGTMDASFTASTNGSVYSVAAQADGKLVLGGNFTSVNGTTGINRIARLNADGTRDTGFNTGSGANSIVDSVALQADGKIIIGGTFFTVAGVTHRSIARLVSDAATQSLNVPDSTQVQWLRSGAGPEVSGVVFELSTDPGSALNAIGNGRRMAGGWQLTNLSLPPSGYLRARGRNTGGQYNGSSGLVDQVMPFGGASIAPLAFTLPASNPTIRTLYPGGPILSTGVTLNGNVSALGSSATVTFEYGPDTNYGTTITASPSPVSGSYLATANAVLTNLPLNTTYHYRVNAVSANGTTQGNDLIFTTPNDDATLSALTLDAATLSPPFDPTDPLATYETYTAVVSSDTTSVVVTPTPNDAKATVNVNGSAIPTGTTKVSVPLVPGINPITILVTATDGVTTLTYNIYVTRTTQPVAAIAHCDVAATSAVLNGAITANAETATTSFEYGLDTNYGTTVAGPSASGGGSVILGVPVTGLTPGTTYHYRVTCTNIIGSVTTSDGSFTTYLTTPPGSIDDTFSLGEVDDYSSITTIAVQPDRKTVVGGNIYIGGVMHNITRVNPDGSLDPTFDAIVNYGVTNMAVQTDGKILIGGYFTSVNGVSCKNLARLNADGTLDTGFNPNPSSQVACVAVQADGKILVGGFFTNIAGVARTYIARLNPADGTLDSDFNPVLDVWVRSIAVQGDGRILLGGTFNTVNGVTQNYLARLNADGTLDSGFTPTLNSSVYSLALGGDGKMVIGGYFSTVNGVSRNGLVRLNADGTLETAFNPNPGGTVNSFAMEADGRIVLGGFFSSVGGVARNRIARLNADGTLDAVFDPDANTTVEAVAVEADGKILLGGYFSTVFGSAQYGLARVVNDEATQSLAAPSSTRVEWLRGGTAPEIGQVNFEVSTDDGTTWSPLGAGTRIAGGWECTGLSLPASGYLRARGRTTSGYNNGSSGLIEAKATFSPTFTETPTLTSPATGIATKSLMNVDFTLPEAALAGSVTLTFDDGTTPCVLTLAGPQEAQGLHSFSLDLANPAASSAIRSGAPIPEGIYTVTLSYQDALGNPAATAASTQVTIDTTAPVLTLPTLVAEATSSAGAPVNFTVTTLDNFDPAPVVQATPPSGSTFAVGLTVVNVTATDAAGNVATGSFTVTVSDTTAPTINAPVNGVTPLTLAVSQGGKVALPDYTSQAVTSDNVGVTSVTQLPAAGTLVPEGMTTVTLTAHDAAGNTADTSFEATVLVSGTVVLSESGMGVPNPAHDPRIPAGAIWGTFGVPSITMSGMNAGWLATVLTPPHGSFHGIFAGPILAPTLRLRTGDPVTDVEGHMVTGTSFRSFREPVFACDEFAVVARVQGKHRGEGIWFGSGGTLREIARTGEVSPGAGRARFAAFTSVAMPTPGAVFFTGRLDEPALRDDGLWVWTEATGVRPALREEYAGDAHGPNNRTKGEPTYVAGFAALGNVNGSPGHGRYDAEAATLDVRLRLEEGPAALATVTPDGSVGMFTLSGDTDADGHRIAGFGIPSSPGAGLPNITSLATLAQDAAAGVTRANHVGVFDHFKGVFRARTGMVAPGAEPATFKSFRDPVAGSGNGGELVQFFAATLAGTAPTNDSGLWAYANRLALVALQGAEPPGAPGAKWKSFTSLSVLDGRGPMFTAKLASGTARVTAANDAGLWATDSTGALRLIVRKGDTLPGGKLKSFNVLGAVAGSPGQRRAWTIGDASARVIYLAFFTDGSSAILSTAVP